MNDMIRAALFAACAAEVAAFSNAGAAAGLGLRRGASRPSICMKDGDDINTKKVAGAIGGVLGNLKSGRGLFGEEMTQKYAKQALEVVEDQVLEVAREIREEEGATQVAKSDKTTKQAAVAKPTYTKDDKWDVIMTGASGEPLEVSVRPTSRVGLLLKAWASENGGDSVDYQLEIKSGTSWVAGVANPESLIGDSGVLDGLEVTISKVSA